MSDLHGTPDTRTTGNGKQGAPGVATGADIDAHDFLTEELEPQKHKDVRQQGWTATIFPDEMSEGFYLWFIDNPNNYCLIGREICPETKRLHWQTYMFFPNKKRWTEVRKLLPIGAHFKPARCGPSNNYLYCTKDGDFVEFGEYRPKIKVEKRTLDMKIRECKSLAEFREKFLSLYIIYGKRIKEYFNEMRGVPENRQLYMLRDKEPWQLYENFALNKIHAVPWQEYTGTEEIVVFENIGEIPKSTIFRWKKGLLCKLHRGYELVNFTPSVVILPKMCFMKIYEELDPSDFEEFEKIFSKYSNIENAPETTCDEEEAILHAQT